MNVDEVIQKAKTELLKIMPEAEVQARIHAIVSENAGLITEGAALAIVAHENGISIERPSPPSEPIHSLTVGELGALERGTWLDDVTLKAKIREVGAPQVTKNGYHLRKVQLAANSPTYLVLWGDQPFNFSPNQTIAIRGFKLDEYQGTLNITPSKYGSLKRAMQQQKLGGPVHD